MTTDPWYWLRFSIALLVVFWIAYRKTRQVSAEEEILRLR